VPQHAGGQKVIRVKLDCLAHNDDSFFRDFAANEDFAKDLIKLRRIVAQLEQFASFCFSLWQHAFIQQQLELVDKNAEVLAGNAGEKHFVITFPGQH
jgi:hypothetical protein